MLIYLHTDNDGQSAFLSALQQRPFVEFSQPKDRMCVGGRGDIAVWLE